jgi:hypothetical protein
MLVISKNTFLTETDSNIHTYNMNEATYMLTCLHAMPAHAEGGGVAKAEREQL